MPTNRHHRQIGTATAANDNPCQIQFSPPLVNGAFSLATARTAVFAGECVGRQAHRRVSPVSPDPRHVSSGIHAELVPHSLRPNTNEKRQEASAPLFIGQEMLRSSSWLPTREWVHEPKHRHLFQGGQVNNM